MFTVSSGAYRKTKIVIDWLNIIIGVAVLIIATAIFILPGKCDILLPVEFFLGAVANGLNATKNYLKYEAKKGHVLVLCTILMLAVTYISAVALW